MTPRLLHQDDVPQCLELCAEAGWNQTQRDWLRLLALEPTGCFGIDDGRQLAATATVITYGQGLAWIGMVLVRVSQRGRGLARTLLQHAIAYTEQRQISCVKLDATDLGEPVYRKLGFELECGVERWVRQPGDPVMLPPAQRYVLDAAWDREVFGADRSTLLWMLERETTLGALDGSYALGRPGKHAAFFGPCVTRSAASGQQMLASFVAQHVGETIYWDRFAENAAREGALLGFQPVRRLKRMYRGVNRPGQPAPQFALAGFELG